MSISETLREIAKESALNKAEKTSLRLIAKKYDDLKTNSAKFAFLLGRYGRHDDDCPLKGKYIGGKECTCGYSEVKKALKEAENL